MTTHEIDIQDVEYLRHGDKPLLARLYKPKGAGPFPIVVDLHGGAWIRGDRLNDAVMNEAMAKAGIVVAALDFRTDEPYPASLADVNYGVAEARTTYGVIGIKVWIFRGEVLTKQEEEQRAALGV